MKSIPSDVELMAHELVRVCAHHRVCLTAFAFSAGDGSEKNPPFVFHFGTIEDNIDTIRKTNELLTAFLKRAEGNTIKTILRKNDA
jgi:hypothetical protein